MHTKLLIRDGNFLGRYQQWKGHSKNAILQALRDDYAKEICGFEHEALVIEKTALCTTLNWQSTIYKPEEMVYLSDYFTEILLEQNYHIQFQKNTETILDKGIRIQHFVCTLKPEISFKESITPDDHYLFGQISFENTIGQNKNTLSISAHYFSHKKYFSFEKLMEILLR